MSTLPDVLPQIKMTGVYGFLLLKKITGLLIKGFHMYDHSFPLRSKAPKGMKRGGSNAAMK